jgi:GTPase
MFDDPSPPKQKSRAEVREDKGRSRRNKNNKEKKEKEKEKEEKPQRVYPPLMIRPRPNEDEEEQLLEDYVQTIYDLRVGDGQSKFVQDFLKEDDEGNCEYKLKLVLPSDDRLDHLATQMKFRVREGKGEAHYRIGVEDNGRPTGLEQGDMLESMRTICLLAGRLGFDAMVFRVTEGLRGLVVELVIRQRHRQGVKLEIRILLLGESGSGKSTLLGVLKSGEMDNGKGSARGNVLTHKHEFMTGSTQSRSHHVIGFDSQGRLYNQKTMMSIEKWLDDSNKLLTFIDVGGHRKA